MCVAAAARAARAAEAGGDVAFVFGNEQAGLTNEEMLACQTLVHIPASPEFSSLNLAQAVQVVAYELFMVSSSQCFPDAKRKAGHSADREGLYAHLERAAVESEFFDPASGSGCPRACGGCFPASRTWSARRSTSCAAC